MISKCKICRAEYSLRPPYTFDGCFACWAGWKFVPRAKKVKSGKGLKRYRKAA